jgi:hypothetical protein
MAPRATTDDTSDALPSFQEAFAAAKEEHSKLAAEEATDDEHALGTEASTDDEKTDEPPTREAKAAAASAESAKPEKKTDATGLITDEEFSQLQTKHANDPAKLRGELEAAFTKKTQALAEQRRSTERLSRYVDIIDAYEADPEATVLALAQQHGLSITRPGETTAETTTETGDTTTAVDAVLTEFKEALGPELEYLADGLAPAITKLVDRLTTTSVQKATEPLKKQTEGLLSKAAVEQTDTVMKAFGESHPDWKTHEDAMFELSQKLAPKGMTEIEYLDHLYKLVTADAKAAAREKDIETQVAERVKKSIARMTKGAEDAETRTDATPERHVRSTPPETPTFQEAFEAAKRGERWV